jgi:hypothetical protein
MEINRRLDYIYWFVLNRILGLCFNLEVNRNVVLWFTRFKIISNNLSSAANSAPIVTEDLGLYHQDLHIVVEDGLQEHYQVTSGKRNKRENVKVG